MMYITKINMRHARDTCQNVSGTCYTYNITTTRKDFKMKSLTASVEDYRIAQQERYAIESAYYVARDKANNPNRLTIRQTQVLMNKYGMDKAILIASRYNKMKGVK